MPFVWTESLNIGDRLTSAKLNEIKTKADTAATQIGITKWTWSSNLTNLVGGNRDLNALYTEMHQAIDYLYDNRTCSSYYTAVLTTNNTTQNSNYNGTVYATNLVSQNATYCSSQNGAVNATNRTSENTSYCGGQNSSVNSTNYSTENVTVYSANDYAANNNKSSENGTVYTANDYAANTNKSTQNATYYSSQLTTNKGTQYSGQNSGYNSSYNKSYSDINLKIILGSIIDPLNKLKRINGYYYYFNSKLTQQLGINDTEKQVGVIAQEVKEIMPEIVYINNSTNYYSVDYSKLTVLLIEAIKTQQKQIDELYNLVNSLGDI